MRNKTKILSLFILSLLTLTCGGGPLLPGRGAWSFLAVIPSGIFPCFGYNRQNAKLYFGYNPKGPWYFPGTSDDNVRIYEYDGKEFRLSFETPYGWGFENGHEVEPRVLDIGFGPDGKGWAVGGYGNPWFGIEEIPIFIRFDGEGWEVINVKTGGIRALKSVIPINDELCWLTESWRPTPGYFDRLFKWDGSRFYFYPQFDNKLRGVAYAPEAGLTYVVTGGEGERPAVHISADLGASWITEEIKFRPVDGYTMQSHVKVGCAVYDRLYLLVPFTNDAWGIVERAGPPGEGEYKLVFFSETSPNFNGLAYMAADREGRLMAVGPSSSVLYEDGVWTREELPYGLEFVGLIAARPRGFWAIAGNDSFPGRYDLVYHY